MRLLHYTSQKDITLTTTFDHNDDKRPQYAILSHTWEENNDEEVTFAEMQVGDGWWKAGYDKIIFSAEQAQKDGLEYCWVDTCCINKTDSSELSEAITSMFQWYRNAQKCYVFLSDVSTRTDDAQRRQKYEWEPEFRMSRWFTRGWTLQELLAPTSIEFFSRQKDSLGTKETLATLLHETTTLPLSALRNEPMSQFSIAERIRWTEKRQTKRQEDRAYCLLGIFEVFMPLIYGEGENAHRRLRDEIDKSHGRAVASRLLAQESTYRSADSTKQTDTNPVDVGHSLQHNVNKGSGTVNNFANIIGNPVFYQVINPDTRNDKIPGSPQSLTISEREFLSSIGPRKYWHIPERVEGTCTWTIESSQYNSWLSATKSSVLWVLGAAGTGKTTLANFLVEQLEQRVSWRDAGLADPIVCSFFCSRQVEGRHDVLSLLQDLILQLAQPRKKIIRVVKSMYGTTKQEYGLSLERAWQMFGTVLSTLACQSLFIAIDALDECDDDWQVQLLKRLANTISSVANNRLTTCKNIKIIISGQPQVRMSWTSKTVEHHQLDIGDRSTGISRDLDLFIETRVAELMEMKFYSVDVGQFLQDSLKSMAESSFLWLDIILKHIENSLAYRLADLKQLLANVPNDLHEVYEKYLPTTPSQHHGMLQRHLQLLIACSRPLSLIEIDVLTLADRDNADIVLAGAGANSNAVRAIMQRTLGSLVWFPNDTAQFCHSTARDFFLTLSQQPDHHLHRSHGVDLDTAHFLCTKLCLSYLLHPSIPPDLFDIARPVTTPIDMTSPVSDHGGWNEHDLFTNMFDIEDVTFLKDSDTVEIELCGVIRQEWQAFDYAARNWPYHLKRTGPILNEDLTAMALSLISGDNGRSRDWYRYQRQQSHLQMPAPNTIHAIVVAAMFDLDHLLRILLEDLPSQRDQQSLAEALFWAASRGCQDTVKLLLIHNAPTKAAHMHQTSLAVAAQGGHEVICDLLLAANDIDPNGRDWRGKSPLILSAEANHVHIVRSILRHRSTRVNEVDGDGRTAFIVACRSGSLESMEVLRTDGRIDVNVADCNGHTAFLHACRSGHLSVVRELLRIPGLDQAGVDFAKRSALSLAAQQGHLQVVRLLMRCKFDPADCDQNGRNSISWAANSIQATAVTDGQESVLQYLIRKAPHASDVKDHDGWTPLAWAMDTPGYVEAARALLASNQVDVNRRDDGGRVPLSWAAASGMTEIVRCFLEHPNIDVNAASPSGATPLMIAADYGMTAIVEVLLQSPRIDIKRRDDRGRTAIDRAVQHYHASIAELLKSHVKL